MLLKSAFHIHFSRHQALVKQRCKSKVSHSFALSLGKRAKPAVCLNTELSQYLSCQQSSLSCADRTNSLTKDLKNHRDYCLDFFNVITKIFPSQQPKMSLLLCPSQKSILYHIEKHFYFKEMLISFKSKMTSSSFKILPTVCRWPKNIPRKQVYLIVIQNCHTVSCAERMKQTASWNKNRCFKPSKKIWTYLLKPCY